MAQAPVEAAANSPGDQDEHDGQGDEAAPPAGRPFSRKKASYAPLRFEVFVQFGGMIFVIKPMTRPNSGIRSKRISLFFR